MNLSATFKPSVRQNFRHLEVTFKPSFSYFEKVARESKKSIINQSSVHPETDVAEIG